MWAEPTHLADVRHLSWFVSALHVPEERRLTAKVQLTDLTLSWINNT